jgi:hypothetical protein
VTANWRKWVQSHVHQATDADPDGDHARPTDGASEVRVVQTPGYIDSVIETHDVAAAVMGALGQTAATAGRSTSALSTRH